MPVFRNWKMTFKINSLVVIMALFIGGIGYTGYFYSFKQNSSMNKMSNDTMPAVKYLDQANADLSGTEALSLELLLAPIENIRAQQITDSIKNLDLELDVALSAYTPLAKTPYEINRLQQLKASLSRYREERQKAFDIVEKNLFDPSLKQDGYNYYSTNAMMNVDPVQVSLSELISYNNQAADKIIALNNQDFRQISRILLYLPVLSIVLALILGVIIARLIAKPLQAMLINVREVARGNLAAEPLAIHSSDEVGLLAEAFNRMTLSLQGLVREVSHTSHLVAQSAEELQAITAENSQGAARLAANMAATASDTEKQALAINETSAAIEQVSAGAQQIAATSGSVTELTGKTASSTKSGEQAVANAVTQMGIIGKKTGQVHSAINNLNQSNQQIREIISFISGISEETNLLALNAAIEAARAGEQGRGFAVVAGEVRKLAEQSKEATLQITSLIQRNLNNLDSAVSAMNEAENDVQTGINVVGEAGREFTEISGQVSEVLIQVTEISSSIQQIASGSQQIVGSVQRISTLSQDNAERVQEVTNSLVEGAASMDSVAKASQSLASIAQELQAAVREFRIS